MQYSALVYFPWLQPLSPSTHTSKMQQLVLDAFTQLQQQQERLSRNLRLQRWQQQQQQQRLQCQQKSQQQLHTSCHSQAAGSNAFLNQWSTLLPHASQQHSSHQQALPYAQTCSPLSSSQPSVVVQLSAAHQGFNQPPGAPCSMPQSSRRKQVPARPLPGGCVRVCGFAPAAYEAAAQGRAAHPTAPANSPDSSQVTRQISHDQRIAEQLANDEQIDHDQQMDDQTVLVTFPADLSALKQLAPANSHSTSGKIPEVSLVTCTRGSEECRMTCRRLLYISLLLTFLTHVSKVRLLVYLDASPIMY